MFDEQKYRLIYLSVQIIGKSDIHDVCGACGNILNAGINMNCWIKKGCEERAQKSKNIMNESIKRLNELCLTNYSFDDFFFEGE